MIISTSNIQYQISNFKSFFYLFIVFIACLISSRGLFTKYQLAGHDSTAYPITQHQFHQNISEGVLFPRWASDMRYGYGHIKLQYRPPVLHYLAEIFHLITGNYFLCINITLILMVFLAGYGMYFFAQRIMPPIFAVISASAYVTANYYLANIYLRGAYYEVAAYAFMPWILWSQIFLFKKLPSPSKTSAIVLSSITIFFGAFLWAALICGHPQIAVFFIPLSMTFIIFLNLKNKNLSALAINFLIFLAGCLLAAPYLYVAIKELPLVRMQLFYVNLENYYRHFLTVKQLFCETWPNNYLEFTGELDYLNRPIHREMRGLNFWAILVLFITPVFWYINKARKSKTYSVSLFFYFWIICSMAFSLSVSKGIWEILPFLHTFNFPWRVLNITSLCLAVLTGIFLNSLTECINKLKNAIPLLVFITVIILIIFAFPHTKGWREKDGIEHEKLTSHQLRWLTGIPQQFYTPKWVKNYATTPSLRNAWATEGKGEVNVINRGANFWNIDINAVTPLNIVLAHYYYPGWQLHGVNSKPLQPEIDENGLLLFKIPKGTYKAKLQFGLTPDRKISYIMFFAGICLVVGICAFTNFKTLNVQGQTYL